MSARISSVTPAVRIVGDRERAARRRVMRHVVGLLGLATVFGIVHVWSRMQVLNARYELTGVEQRLQQLEKSIAQEEGEVAAAKSMERLMRVAHDQLGLAPPTLGQVVYVQGDAARVP
ncbi:MAG: hypothetical protein HY696_10650 [Deltaproteobacteria bacterium]|nr:hypothetical protein [Deltaproteobacteria bacterium]